MQGMDQPILKIRLHGLILLPMEADTLRGIPFGHSRLCHAHIVAKFRVLYSSHMEIKALLAEARAIWGEQRLTLGQILVRLGVDYGDLCRWERGADKDRGTHTQEEVKKEMGNIIFSMIRWCNDLGYDPEECIALAKETQRTFVENNRNR